MITIPPDPSDEPLHQLGLSTAGARNLASTKSRPQMQSITSRRLLEMLP